MTERRPQDINLQKV